MVENHTFSLFLFENQNYFSYIKVQDMPLHFATKSSQSKNLDASPNVKVLTVSDVSNVPKWSKII